MSALSSSSDKASASSVRALNGFTLVVRETPNREQTDITLTFDRVPDEQWEEIARGVVTRMSCIKPSDLPAPFGGKCQSHSPRYVEMLMQDALARVQSANGESSVSLNDTLAKQNEKEGQL